MKRKPEPEPTKGRPHRVTIELSDEEKAQLETAVTDSGLSRSDVLRQAIRNYPRPMAGIKRGEGR